MHNKFYGEYQNYIGFNETSCYNLKEYIFMVKDDYWLFNFHFYIRMTNELEFHQKANSHWLMVIKVDTHFCFVIYLWFPRKAQDI